MLVTNGLRDDFTKDDDAEGGRDQPNNARGEIRHDDGETGVDNDISKEERAQEIVAVLANREDPMGVLALLGRATGNKNLQLHQIKAEQAEGESREEGREDEQEDDEENAQPEWEASVLGHITGRLGPPHDMHLAGIALFKLLKGRLPFAIRGRRAHKVHNGGEGHHQAVVWGQLEGAAHRPRGQRQRETPIMGEIVRLVPRCPEAERQRRIGVVHQAHSS